MIFPHPVDATEVWAPLTLTAVTAQQDDGSSFEVVARLREGVDPVVASADVARLATGTAHGTAGDPREATYLVNPLVEEAGLGTAPPAVVVAVGLVLVIAWINLAGLVIARHSVRRRELSVRRVLGAAPGHIVRLLLGEALLLAALATVVGMSLADVGSRVVLGTALRWNIGALLLALIVGLLSGVAIGAWPALRFAALGPADGPKGSSRTASVGKDMARGRRTLIITEIALATVLLSATGLLVRTIYNIYRIEPGFDADGVLAVRVWDSPGAGVDSPRTGRFDQLVEALEAVPGVERAGAVLGLPYGLGAPTSRFEIEGGGAVGHEARMRAATPGYFAALGIPLTRGRAFGAADGADAPPVAILNEAAARTFFPAGDPIGRGILIDGARWEVVGVVGTVFDGDQENPAKPEIYRPMRQWPRSSVWIALRTRADPTEPAPTIRRAVRDFDPDIAVTRLLTMDALRVDSMGSELRMLRLMAAFALAAVLISAIGLYGVISYIVSARARELAVRRTLGAPKSAVLRLVLAQGVGAAGIGSAVGVVGALGASRAMRSLLFGVSPTDPLTLVSAVAVVCGVAILATYLPAQRAASIDPATSLSDA